MTAENDGIKILISALPDMFIADELKQVANMTFGYIVKLKKGIYYMDLKAHSNPILLAGIGSDQYNELVTLATAKPS